MNLYEICHGLAQHGHQISLLYQRDGNLLAPYQTFCDETIKVDRYGFDRRKISEIIQFLPSLAKIQTIPVRSNSIVLSNSCHPAFYSYLLSSYRKLPLVCYIQSPTFNFNRQKRMALNGVRKFITVSHHMKQYWSELGYEKQKIDVVLNGTDTEKFQPAANFSALRQKWNIPEDTRVIGFVGRLDREKGVATLIKAIALLLKENSKIKLLMAGKSVLSTKMEANGQYSEKGGKDYEYFLEKLVAELGVEQQVSFLGHVTNTAEIYQLSDVTAVPSETPDPCPRVVLESLSCGTPVVGSKMGGIPEMLAAFPENLVEAGDEIALAQALGRVMAWRTTDPTLGQRCRDHILSKFSLERLVDGIEQSLLEVANG